MSFNGFPASFANSFHHSGFNARGGKTTYLYVAYFVTDSSDTRLARLNPDDGSIIWERHVGADWNMNLSTGLLARKPIAVDAEGNCVCAATGGTSGGSPSVIMAKLSKADGSVIWSLTDSLALGDSGIEIDPVSGLIWNRFNRACDTDGNLVIPFWPGTGGSHFSMDHEGNSVSARTNTFGNDGVDVLRYDLSGTLLNSFTLRPTTGDAVLLAASCTRRAEIVIYGYIHNIPSFPSGHRFVITWPVTDTGEHILSPSAVGVRPWASASGEYDQQRATWCLMGTGQVSFPHPAQINDHPQLPTTAGTFKWIRPIIASAGGFGYVAGQRNYPPAPDPGDANVMKMAGPHYPDDLVWKVELGGAAGHGLSVIAREV